MATVKYAYVGDRSEIIGDGAQQFTKYGQAVELEQSFAENHILNQNLPLITAEQFELSGPVPTDKSKLPAHSFTSRQSLHEFRNVLKAQSAQPAAQESTT